MCGAACEDGSQGCCTAVWLYMGKPNTPRRMLYMRTAVYGKPMHIFSRAVSNLFRQVKCLKDYFDQFFLSLLKSVAREDKGGTSINQERLNLLQEVYRDASDAFGDSAKVSLKLHQGFYSGSVVVDADCVSLSEPQVQKLKEILRRTDVISIDGDLKKSVSVSFMVQHVFDL